MSGKVYWLSSHAAYRCRHAGACCRAGWPIPLEVHRVAAISSAVDEGRIPVARPWLVAAVDGPADAAGTLAVGAGGHCAFHHADRCAIHGALGHGALPTACQHFPRICLVDARGAFVTLSHFCPTAATMAFEERPVAIVEGPLALPDGAEPEGLDARDAWPPLLTERKLMDHESYGAFERHMVRVLAGEDRAASPEAALAGLRAEVTARTGLPRRSLFELTRDAVPQPFHWPAVPPDFDDEWAARVQPAWSSWAPVVQRFLAAHAFASWLAYQGRGLHAIVSGLDAALAVLEVELVRVCRSRATVLNRASLHEAIRQADLLLRHYVDRQAFADALSTSNVAINGA